MIGSAIWPPSLPAWGFDSGLSGRLRAIAASFAAARGCSTAGPRESAIRTISDWHQRMSSDWHQRTGPQGRQS